MTSCVGIARAVRPGCFTAAVPGPHRISRTGYGPRARWRLTFSICPGVRAWMGRRPRPPGPIGRHGLAIGVGHAGGRPPSPILKRWYGRDLKPGTQRPWPTAACGASSGVCGEAIALGRREEPGPTRPYWTMVPRPRDPHPRGPEIALRDSPRPHTPRGAGSGARYTGRHRATFPLKARTGDGHPIRPAIIVAGIAGNAASSSRIRGSNPPATGPCGLRTGFGGLPLASAASAVFRGIPVTSVISAIGRSSARRSRRIPDPALHPQRLRPPQLSWSQNPGGSRSKFGLPRPGQRSVPASTSGTARSGPAGVLPGSGPDRVAS